MFLSVVRRWFCFTKPATIPEKGNFRFAKAAVTHMITNTKYKMNAMSKDFGLKTKEFSGYAEKAGLKSKSNMAVLEAEEFDALLTVLTVENQIEDIGGYLNGETFIKTDKREKAKNAKNSEELPAKKPVLSQTPEAKHLESDGKKNHERSGERLPEKNSESDVEKNSAKKSLSVKPAPVVKSKAELQAEKQARFKDALQKQMGIQAQKQAQKQQEQQKKQQRQQQKQQNQPKILPRSDTFDSLSMTTVTTLEEKSSHVAGTRVVDTRGGGNVDLSKYDEKLERMVDTSKKNFTGGTQKLKKQNKNSQQEGMRGKNAQNTQFDRFRHQQQKSKSLPPKQLEFTIGEEIAVSELASKLRRTAAEVVKKLMMMGMMVSVSQTIDYDTAYLVADEFGAKVSKEVVVTIEDKLFETEEDAEEDKVERAPVVCVMGHVDHGKTSLLDAIRHTNVTAGEAGGITQHIGAYRVQINGKDITFLDTPGHEAFTAMRARGAKSTDIAILVVAADDGIMPQTVEAINHAKAANIDIIVAINKMDKPHANPEQVKQGLTQYNLVPEEWGGDVICVPVSAVTKQGIDELLENVLLVAEMKQLKANPNRRASGLVIEARLDKGRGPVATLLVQNGTLHAGDIVIAGTTVGRVRAMTDERGKTMKTAGPSVPVEITGLAEVPQAGDEFNAVEDERMARELAEQRKSKIKEDIYRTSAKVSLDDLFNQISAGAKELNIIVKADVGGSAEAVKANLEKLSNDEVKVRVIHSAVGGITEGDVMLAAASNAIIVGFNVRPDKVALDSAKRQSVDIRTYRVIYECTDEIEAAMKGMLAPKFREELLGHAEVRQTIHVPNVGTIAGCYVQDGKITRKAQIRIVRDGVVIFEDRVSSLRRFKDDVREVASGYECGVGIEKFNDIKVGDILEAFEMVEVARD